jgi:adenylosuccinate lyase
VIEAKDDPETGDWRLGVEVIERYTLPKMGSIWTEKNKFRKWLEVEILACEAHAQLGNIPQDAAREIRAKADFDVERIKEIEKEVHHDVIAFLTSVAEFVGPSSRYIHYGMTSSDVLDTGLALQTREAADVLIENVKRLIAVLKRLAKQYKNTPMMGRTHGVHAEPITFGLKLALWVFEMKRNLARLERARETVSYGKISGTVGTYANAEPFVEEYVCGKLKLKPAEVSSQIIQRGIVIGEICH